MKRKLLSLSVLLIICATGIAQNIDYSVRCMQTRMKHDCDYIGNEEGRFSVQCSDDLNFGLWYRAGNGTGNLNECLGCDGDANTSNGYSCPWNIEIINKSDVDVSIIRLSFRASEDDNALSDIYDWWMNDDCTWDLLAYDIPLSGVTPGVNYNIEVGHTSDPQWYVTYRILWDYVPVNTPSVPVAAENPACGSTDLLAVTSTQNDVTWYWQGTNPAGTSTANPSTSPYPVSVTGTYFIRAKGNSNNVWSSFSSSVFVEVGAASVAASSIDITNNSTPYGTFKTLSPVGGNLGSGAVWSWFADAGCTILVDTGNFLAVNPPTTTTYWLRAEGDCDTTTVVSGIVIVDGSGISEFFQGSAFMIFPNPAGEILTIKSANDLQGSEFYRILDLSGKCVIEGKLSDKETRIGISMISSGLYFLEIIGSQSISHHRLIKE